MSAVARPLTEMQAYQAMIKFLPDYDDPTKADDDGSLLGSTDLLGMDNLLTGRWGTNGGITSIPY